MMGSVVENKFVHSDKISHNMRSLSDGVYITSVEDIGEGTSQKVIVR